MTPQQKSALTRKAWAVAHTLCMDFEDNKYRGNTCKGCVLLGKVAKRDYKAMQKAIKAAKV